MIVQSRVLIMLLLLLATTFATRARAADATGAIVVSCPVERTPPLHDVERLLGTTTLQSTANARARVMHLVRQACGRGALAVRIVAGAEAQASFVQRDALDLARGLPVR